MSLETAIQSFGGISQFAKAIHVKPQLVVNWRSRGVPAERCPLIEQATGGLVRCEELRPDVEWGVLRKGRENADI